MLLRFMQQETLKWPDIQVSIFCKHLVGKSKFVLIGFHNIIRIFHIQIEIIKTTPNNATHLLLMKFSDFLKNNSKVFFLESKSKIIQKGMTIIAAASNIPMGFEYNAFWISPRKNKRTEFVLPHEGQGIVVICLNKQTPMGS